MAEMAMRNWLVERRLYYVLPKGRRDRFIEASSAQDALAPDMAGNARAMRPPIAAQHQLFLLLQPSGAFVFPVFFNHHPNTQNGFY